jgi:hypothetical protein
VDTPSAKIKTPKLNPLYFPMLAMPYIWSVFNKGLVKYSPFSWRDGETGSMELLNAALRHIYLYVSGTDLDSESGESHISHAAANLLLLLDMLENGTLVDNRPVVSEKARYEFQKRLYNE